LIIFKENLKKIIHKSEVRKISVFYAKIT